MAKGFGRLFFTGLLILLLLPVGFAWADKVAEPMVFATDRPAIAVLSLYETDPATQADAVKSFYKLTKSFYKTIPGFYGLALLSSSDGARVAELSQWQDQASYDAFKASLTSGGGDADYTQYYEKYAGARGSKDKGKTKETVDLGEPFLTASFAVEAIASPPGMVASIPGTTALVQISEFAAADADGQGELIAIAQAMLAGLPQLYPAPRTALLLRGLDDRQVGLLTTWGNAAEFADTSQLPLLSLGSPDPAAAFPPTDDRLYQTIKVITPKAEKYGKD
jgi:heme-degrading monooxygenase HmoA